MKTLMIATALLSLAGLSPAQDEEKNPFDKLKDAVTKKDADAVKTLEPEAYKFAQGMITAAKPADAEEAKTWASRVESGKEIATYTEYALASMAEQPGTDPAKVVGLVDLLIAQNPKSQYLDEICANVYLMALGKAGGAAKQMDGMAKIAKGRPDNIVALSALVEGRPGSLQNANGLLAAARKPKPEALPEGEWEKMKNTALANGYFYVGFISGQKQSWLDCDKNLKAALPLISADGNKTEIAYFSLGICDYQFGKLTADRSKMMAGQQYMEKAATSKGPYQSQAYQQNNAMKTELAGRR